MLKTSADHSKQPGGVPGPRLVPDGEYPAVARTLEQDMTCEMLRWTLLTAGSPS